MVKRYASSANIPMKGYTYVGQYNNDFGCGYSQFFYTVDSTTLGITNISESSAGINAYPNPAQNNVFVEISGVDDVNGQIHIIDALGRTVSVTTCKEANKQIETGHLVNGVYTIFFVDGANNKLTTRLLIAK